MAMRAQKEILSRDLAAVSIGACNVELRACVLLSLDYTHGLIPMKIMRGCERKEKLCCNCCRFFLAVRLLVLIYSGGYGFGGGIFVNLSPAQPLQRSGNHCN
jgi:hypothetical protein